MQHYQNCLEARIKLWLKRPLPVTCNEWTLKVEGTPALEFEFLARECKWVLSSSLGTLDLGSFDRVTKSARKLWSGLLSEEEAAELTRTSGRMGRRDTSMLLGEQ